MNSWCLRFLLLVVLCSWFPASRLFADDVDEYIHEQMKARHIPGVVLLALKDGRVIKQQSYGLANVELRVPASKESVFPLASVTKVFTATAVYLLVQERKVRLDDTVVQFLPGLPEAWKKITVLNCLTHTSGLPDLFPVSPVGAPSDWIAAATQEEALRKVAAVPLQYETGSKSIYNQTEFLLLKMIIEKISGMPVEKFLDKRIFKPIGMTSARFADAVDIVPNRVALYMNFKPLPDRFHVERKADGDGLPSPDGKLWNDISFLYPEYEHGGVGLNMTAMDLGSFDTALNSGRVLNREILDQMWAPFRLSDGRQAEFAGGWDTALLNGHRMVFHIGASMVEYAHLIDANLTIILLTNNKGFNPFSLTIGVMRFFAPQIEKVGK